MLPCRELDDWNLNDWDALSDAAQLRVAREALLRAADAVAHHAEQLAGEMEAGAISDRGGPEALRLLASMVRLTDRDTRVPAGHA
jgi:hypothetical protein